MHNGETWQTGAVDAEMNELMFTFAPVKTIFPDTKIKSTTFGLIMR